MGAFNIWRSFLLSAAIAPLASLAQGPPNTEPSDWATSPPYEWLFEDEMPIPPVKEPKDINGVSYYEFVVESFTQQVYKDGRGPTTFVGYDGMYPGPTIKQKRGVNSVVRVVNNWTAPIVTHLHGSHSRAPFDGWAEDLVGPSQFKDYYYSNWQTARTIWYHDHADRQTAQNNFLGQVGQYHIIDPGVEDSLCLPSGDFDIPITITSAQFNEDGSLWSLNENNERFSVYGDVIMVNGVPWPKLTVQPRKYRFRVLNGAVSRSFFLYVEEEGPQPVSHDSEDGGSGRGGNGGRGSGSGDEDSDSDDGDDEDSDSDGGDDGGRDRPTAGTRIPFTIIASDSGFLPHPITVQEVYLSMAERYEVIIDFSPHRGKKLTVRNVRGFANDLDFKHTDKVMQFHVLDGDEEEYPDDSSIPEQLPAIEYPPPRPGARERSFTFDVSPGRGWTINGVRFDDVANRILANPERGAVERWTLVNSSPGWSHPVHLHLVDFRVLSRSQARGHPRPALAYETLGLKDTVWLAEGETVVVEAVFSPWPGVFMFHCHNLVHEDHAMMAGFNVSLLHDFGYEEGLHFADPLDPAYAARDCVVANLHSRRGVFSDAEIERAVADLEATEAYKDIGAVEDALDEYWANRPAAGTKRHVQVKRSAKFRM